RAHEVWEVLVEDERFEVAAEPTLSTGLMRYRPAGLGTTDADSLNPRIRHALLDRGDVMVAGTTLAGRSRLKFTPRNPGTHPEHLRGSLETSAATGGALSTEDTLGELQLRELEAARCPVGSTTSSASGSAPSSSGSPRSPATSRTATESS